MYGIARGAGFILSGGQPVSIQTNGIGQIGNGYLLYLLPDGRISFFHLPSNLEGVRPSQIVTASLSLDFPDRLWSSSAPGCSRRRALEDILRVGGSEEASRRAVSVVRHTILIYVLSALLASLAGCALHIALQQRSRRCRDPPCSPPSRR